MVNIIRRAASLLWDNFGHCQRCMHRALQGTLIAWGGVTASAIVGYGPLVVVLMLVAILVTTVWLIHVVVFAIKTSLVANRTRPPELGAFSRRQFLASFISALGVGAITTLSYSVSWAADFSSGEDVSSGGYILESCCRKPSGVCRCGSSSGYLADCATSCGVALTAVRAMAALPSLPSFTAVGHLFDVHTRKPLAEERVVLVIPGGKSFQAVTDTGGRFKISVGANPSRKSLDIGKLPSVAPGARVAGESSNFYLFLRAG